MSDDVDPQDESEDDERKPLGWKVIAGAVLLLFLFGLILFGGVRGCATESPQDIAKREEKEKKERKEKDKDKEKKDQEDPKIDFPVVLPNEPGVIDQFVKPGHWAVASQKMQARERDFSGHTQTEVLDNNNSVLIASTPFMFQTTRPTALAKGSTKFVESTFYVPTASDKLTLSLKFDEGGLGFTRDRAAPLRVLHPHQYHFVVLAKEPDRYSLLKTLDSIQTPYKGEPPPNNNGSDGFDEPDTLDRRIQYLVELTEAGRNVPLSDNPLLWTTISYLLWDEVDPEPFTPEQEKALIDWLHWGGQLIVNGPDSLDLIKGSFLAPFMPATSDGPREIATSDLRTFNENWLVKTDKFPGTPLAPVAPWSGITLVPTDAADKALWEATGGLIAERAVGRGRVVVSAMQLMERDLVNWRSGYESWFNACLLRRPPRQYHQVAIGSASLLWDTSTDSSLKDRRLDARLNTGLRYLARDLGVETSFRWVQPQDGSGNPNTTWQVRGRAMGNFNGSGPEYQPPTNAGGLGAWSDFNLTAAAARGALREAAGVDVPNRAFVVGCLAAYLVVLVPVNWAIFKMLGRVEWAWIAAPIIAIVGTYIVVQRAQLDIGFVRSQTEIGLLELQPDHARAHLSRYTALYTSLSTTYDLGFDDPTALAMPFPNEANPNLRNQNRSMIQFQRQLEGVRMTGLPILSNSTNFVHSEQMFSLEGPIRIGKSSATGGWQLENRSQLRLQGVGIVRKESDGLHGVWIGELGPGQSTSIQDPSRLPSLADPSSPFGIERVEAAKLVKESRLNLEPLIKLAYQDGSIEPGETRLVAHLEEPLAGEVVSPEASQLRTGTLVIAHLGYGPLAQPRHNVNTRQDMKIDSEEL